MEQEQHFSNEMSRNKQENDPYFELTETQHCQCIFFYKESRLGRLDEMRLETQTLTECCLTLNLEIITLNIGLLHYDRQAASLELAGKGQTTLHCLLFSILFCTTAALFSFISFSIQS